MKVTDLMIGDWVKVLPISRKVEAHNSQVGALTRNVDNTISIEGGYFPAWKGWSVSEEYIEPIPLTPEILEMNGFENDDEDGGKKWYDLYNDLGELSFFIKVSEIGLWIPVSMYGEGAVLKYVHQLQHALRLCGLNELADNFKVE